MESNETYLSKPHWANVALAGKCCTVPINALRPVGCSVDPEYEAFMASKLIESNETDLSKPHWANVAR